MSLNIHFNSHKDLRDAIAYEFFMDNIQGILNTFTGNESNELALYVQELAKASYLIADKFITAREQSLITEENEPSTEES